MSEKMMKQANGNPVLPTFSGSAGHFHQCRGSQCGQGPLTPQHSLTCLWFYAELRAPAAINS